MGDEANREKVQSVGSELEREWFLGDLCVSAVSEEDCGLGGEQIYRMLE
jgi:hypothetical protein